MQTVTWIMSAIALGGTILNAQRNRLGFYAWAVTNIFWCIVDFKAGLYAQSALFFAYFLLAIKGLITWKKKEDAEKNKMYEKVYKLPKEK